MDSHIDTIYVDMDNCLVALEPHLEYLEGIPLNEVITHETDGPVMHLIRKHIDREPFVHCGRMDGFGDLVDWMNGWKTSGMRVMILSSATHDNTVYSRVAEQKQRWLDANGLGDFLAIYTHGGRDKALWAHPNSLLIDDYEKNVSRFIDAGGHGIVHRGIDTTRDELVSFGLL